MDLILEMLQAAMYSAFTFIALTVITNIGPALVKLLQHKRIPAAIRATIELAKPLVQTEWELFLKDLKARAADGSLSREDFKAAGQESKRRVMARLKEYLTDNHASDPVRDAVMKYLGDIVETALREVREEAKKRIQGA